MLLENELLHNLSKIIPRHPDQLNKLLESDAELIKIGKDFTIAITTDTIIEEIKVGLYKDPYLIGWMMATSNFSDIAAVGAEPIGLLVNMSISEDLGLDFIQTIYRGIADACDLCGANILGGDTNHAGYLELGGTAWG
jgi:thiamine-monophosphate kinase